MTLDDIKSYTYQQAEKAWRAGRFSDAVWAEYQHLWQSSAPRFALRACYCASCQATSGAFDD